MFNYKFNKTIFRNEVIIVSGVIINLIILIPFLIFAFYLSKGKSASLRAGYNTMSDSKKAQYDEVAMCKFIGKLYIASRL